MAVQSMLGYFGGLIGRLVLGIVPVLAAGMSPPAWGITCMHFGVVVLAGTMALSVLRPKDLAGDRSSV
tara:strand:+ start:256 stop:459 length:204 start_codon:yes stop_codon:yes gene_type:complete